MTHSVPDAHAASHSHASPAGHGDAHAAGHAHPNYLLIFGILILLTVASVIADMVGGSIGKVLVGLIVLVIASLKAMYVLLYFMHLKFEGAWKYVLLAPTIVLALAIPAALAPDIAFKYYDPQAPQAKALREQEAEEVKLGHPAGGAHAEPAPAAAHP
ncbi:MAG: cytochrome C oxidase subunit IV family protein [Planctomycetaceae bacterium]|jgi:cytochrome c oxidase subunit 4